MILQDCIHGEGTTQVQAGLAGHSHSIYNPGKSEQYSVLIFSRKFSYEFYVFRGDVVYKPKSYSNPSKLLPILLYQELLDADRIKENAEDYALIYQVADINTSSFNFPNITDR